MTQQRFSAILLGLIPPQQTGPETPCDRLGRRGNALQSNESQIMGRLRFNFRTNRLVADRFHPFFEAMTGVSFKSLLKCLLDLGNSPTETG